MDGVGARRPMRCLGLVELIYVLFLVTRVVYCIIRCPWDPLGTPLAVGQTFAFGAMLFGAYLTMEVHFEIMVMLINESFYLNFHRWQGKGETGLNPKVGPFVLPISLYH